MKYTYYGDADLSGIVDGTDYALTDNGFNSRLAGWLNGDFDYTGNVDGTDYALIDNAFNSQGSPLAEPAVPAAVPNVPAALDDVGPRRRARRVAATALDAVLAAWDRWAASERDW